MRWAYFDVAGNCEIITTNKATVLNFPYEREVPDTYKPNSTRLNITTGEVEQFQRPPIPPSPEVESPLMKRIKALEERVTKLEHP